MPLPILPPAYDLVTLDAELDAFERAVRLAPRGLDDGTVYWVDRPDRLDMAMVLEPEAPVPTTLEALYVMTVAAGDALEAHVRDELGITDSLRARPIQAAFASAVAFAAGGLLPIVTAVVAPQAQVGRLAAVTTIGCLLLLGGLAAKFGGASIVRGAVRVTFWGALAMALTALVGRLVGMQL